jgi:hypothetical protein
MKFSCQKRRPCRGETSQSSTHTRLAEKRERKEKEKEKGHLFVVDGRVDEDDVQVVVDVLEVGPLPRVGMPNNDAQPKVNINVSLIESHLFGGKGRGKGSCKRTSRPP